MLIDSYCGFVSLMVDQYSFHCVRLFLEFFVSGVSRMIKL